MLSVVNEGKGKKTVMMCNNIVIQLVRLLEEQKLISENERQKMLEILKRGV